TGAHEVHGDILTRYGQLGGSAWGYPTTDETGTPDKRGRFNHFRNVANGGELSIYWTPETGAREVFGLIRNGWSKLGWERSPLGYPTSGEMATHDGVGRWQTFEGGIYVWHPDTGAHEVHGDILTRYGQLGGSAWGYPITDEGDAKGPGRFNHFRQVPGGGEMSIYWTPGTGAQPVYGLIRQRWAELGWERSHLGYPTGPEVDWPGGGNGSRQQAFQHGRMLYRADRNAAAPDPIDMLHDFGKGSELQGWVSVKMYADGRVENFGHMRATGASSYAFQVHVGLTNGRVGVANAWTDEVAGTFESGSRNADWYEDSHSPVAAAAFWDLQGDARIVAQRSSERSLGALTDVLETGLKFFLGSGAAVVLGPFGASLVVVGTLAGTVLSGGNVQGGLTLLNGTLWMVGPGGTFVALLAAGVAKLMTEERDLREDERALARAVFGDKLDLGRIRVTNAAGSEGDSGEDRPFVFPRFDGKITINMGQWEEDTLGMKVGQRRYVDDPSRRRIARGEKFLHELVHVWQIQHGSDEGLVLSGLAKIFGEDYGYVPGKSFEGYDLEPQAAIVQDWYGENYQSGVDYGVWMNSATATKHPLYGYIRDNIRTGIGSTI
ncbi:MAG: LGFP repeat-containing protein, partial [Gammaproteobacteria bacterium]